MTWSVEVPESSQCAFCAYLNGERPYTVVVRSELAAILVTREQRGLPHLLVVATRHVETILDLEDDEAQCIAVAIREVARAIDGEYARPGIAVWQNNGMAANQKIAHCHFHVAGTLESGGTEFGDVQEVPQSETDLVGARLRQQLLAALPGFVGPSE
jgi:histidine triad (HIT) family protein